jgi:HEAT repeat protein
MTSSRLKTGTLDEQKAWDRYFEYLIKALRDPDPSARARAAHILGENREPNAAEALKMAMMDDADMTVRNEAAVALGRLGVVEPLIDALAMPDARVRLTATQALGQIGDPRGIKPLIVALRDSSNEVRSHAAFALKKIGAPAVEALLAALRHPEATVRWASARILGSLGDKRALPELERLAREDDAPVTMPMGTGPLRTTRPLNTVGQAARQAIEKIKDKK